MRTRNTVNLDSIAYWLFGDRIPATKLVIISNVATYLAIVLFKVPEILVYGGFSTTTVSAMPWTLVTYPLVGMCGGAISLLFACYWLWWAGGSLERSWGTRTYALYFFGMSAISALGLYVGFLVTGAAAKLTGLWLPIAGVTIAFAMLNPEQQILFFFIIPMKLKYLALLDVILVLVSFGRSNVLLGLFALAGCAFSYWYVRRGRLLGCHARRYDDGDKVIRLQGRPSRLGRLNPLGWYARYRDRKRFRNFLDKSGFGE